ncbi:DUF4168 domain-containing protein [Pseudohaliea rubra]|uniref:Putative conserved secreted protein n=1 Tax=Pseudohaliea rubra DSM 19751 TaxID=1265313 RepID=A0A095VMP0_9GAMM|nr:DUF4168 domain-containing protein [Pseudohaliea rubra]KGE02752.1 putative conserved secreted protein [Pseudohaliea rubra DSM 19751]
MTFKATSLVLALSLGAVPLASAQYNAAQGQGNTAPPRAQQQTAEVSDSDLALFQKASGKIAEIRQEYQQALPKAESTEEAQALQEEASQSMVNAVESFGLTVDEFNQIAAAMQANPELRERLNLMQGG